MNNDASSPSDTEVVRLVLAGNIDAFEHLLRKYQNHVLTILKKHLPPNHIEEVSQNVFIRVYESLPTFKGESSIKPWLSTIAVRTCYDFWRKHYRSRELPMSSLTERHQLWLEKAISAESSQSFHALALQTEARELLDWALDKLSAEDRMVLELVYLEGLSTKEAADLLGWSVANVKVRSFRSRKKLYRLLTQEIESRGSAT